MTSKALFVALAAAVTVATPLSAQPFNLWKEVNEWKIFVNEATDGCFMEYGTPDNYVFHIGTTDEMFGRDESERKYFLGFYAPINSGFAGIQTEEVKFTTGPDAFVGDAYSYQRENHHGWWVEVDNDNLIDDLRSRGELRITSASGGAVAINLFELRIDEAFEEMKECQLQN